MRFYRDIQDETLSASTIQCWTPHTSQAVCIFGVSSASARDYVTCVLAKCETWSKVACLAGRQSLYSATCRMEKFFVMDHFFKNTSGSWNGNFKSLFPASCRLPNVVVCCMRSSPLRCGHTTNYPAGPQLSAKQLRDLVAQLECIFFTPLHSSRQQHLRDREEGAPPLGTHILQPAQ